MKNAEDAIVVSKKESDDELEGFAKTAFQVIWIVPIIIGGVFIKFPFFILGWVVAKLVSGIIRLFVRN